MTDKLISSYEIGETIDRLQDAWGPNWMGDPHKKLALDDLYEAQCHIEAIESAARRQSLRPMLTEMFADRLGFVEGASDRSTSSDSLPASVDEPTMLRSKGAL